MSRRSLLTAEERRRLFAIAETEAEIIRHYTLSAEDLERALARHGDRNRFGFALQICLMRHRGVALRPNERIPTAVLDYLAYQLGIPVSVMTSYARRDQTRLDHAAEVMHLFGLRPFSRTDLTLAIDAATEAAWSIDNGQMIAQAILQALRDKGIVLPSIDTIERAGLAGRARARRRTAEMLISEMSAEQIASIDRLLEVDPEIGVSRFAWLKDIAESPSAANMAGLLKRLTFIRAIDVVPEVVDRINPSRFGQLIREGTIAPAFMLSDYGPHRRRAVLIACLVDLEMRLADAAIDMFDKLMGSLFTRARRGQERRYQATTRDVSRLMRMFGETITALTEARDGDVDVVAAIDETVGWHRLIAAKPQVDALAELADQDMLLTAAERYHSLRRFAPTFLEAFEFSFRAGSGSLLEAIELLKELNRRGARDVPGSAPMPFRNRRWRRLISENGRINRRLYETAVLSRLRDGLRAGDIWLERSKAYRRFENYLVAEAETELSLSGLPIHREADGYLADRRAMLDARLVHFAGALQAGRIEGVKLDGDRLKVSPLPPVTPPEAAVLDRRLDSLLPRVRVTALLQEVAARTGFLDAFRDPRTGAPHDTPNAVHAAVLADATNLGLERMADASEGVSYAQLSWTHAWYLSEESYRAALAEIVDAHDALSFVRHWGDGSTSSSDGQFFRTGRGRSGAAAVNARYGDAPGLKVYSHLTDHFASFHSQILSATASEAAYVLDGLLLHNSSLAPSTHYTDTGGATDMIFALCHLLGFRFAPRLRDLGDRRLASMPLMRVDQVLQPIIGRPIQIEVITECWDDIRRLVASIKAGVTAPSTLLRKLGAYRRQNRLALALSEIGRIERTLFTLDWLEQPDLRRACQAGLNKGEARNTLAQAVFTNRQGRFADRTFKTQQHRASGLNLVIAAIAYWNTLYLEKAAEHLRAHGELVDDCLLPHISPMGWAHIGLTGDYLWNRNEHPSAGSLRPLNDPSNRLHNAA